MLFVTNRVLQEGPTPVTDRARQGRSIPINPEEIYQLPRPVHFALENNQAEQAVYFCRRNGYGDYTEIGSQNFFNELKTLNVQQILLYIHGYSSLPEPAIFPKTAELQTLFEQMASRAVLVVPLIWPCDNDLGAVKDYFDDQIAADASDIAFARLFEKFLAWREDNSTVENPCIKRLNVLAHSMGNRVLRGAFTRAIEYYQPGGVPLLFRNIFMAAADVLNETLEPGQAGQYIPQIARNVVVYFAADDLAMRASKVANVRMASRRLGHTGPERMERVANNVYALDCGDFNNTYDSPLGHGYFASDSTGKAGLLFEHLWECIRTGRVPMKPSEARTSILLERFWQSNQ